MSDSDEKRRGYRVWREKTRPVAYRLPESFVAEVERAARELGQSPKMVLVAAALEGLDYFRELGPGDACIRIAELIGPLKA